MNDQVSASAIKGIAKVKLENIVEPSGLLCEGTSLGKRGPSWNRASGRRGNTLLGLHCWIKPSWN